MSSSIQFETPENVQVSYEPAGLGTRFLAWLLDYILLLAASIVIFFVLVIAGIGSDTLVRPPGVDRQEFEDDFERSVFLYFMGLFILIQGIGSLGYFAGFEVWRRGQTFGKRRLGLRVVKLDGFSLDTGSILVRTVFRVIDHLPPLWIVPVVSAKSQRFGDMAAGTIVVSDKPQESVALRDQLEARPAAEVQFLFDAARLKNVRPCDIQAVQSLLERWPGLPKAYQRTLLAQVVDPLAKRLRVPCPEPADQLRFLEDFLTAEYRRQHRGLG